MPHWREGRLLKGSGFRGFGLQGSGFRVPGFGFRVFGFKVQGSGFRFFGFRVSGSGLIGFRIVGLQSLSPKSPQPQLGARALR